MTIEPTTPAAPGRVGQATHVEQARAVAEVAAVVQVAQMNPRDVEKSRREMRRECSEFLTADAAFFRYNRGGKTVTGPTVKLARTLKRCWGNIQSGWSELRRDDEYGQSELQSWAWDMQANVRSAVNFVVPHANYYTGSPLTALRDIYEGNANQGSRREREQILGLLPAWFVEEALTICRKTLVEGNGDPLVVRQDKAEAAMKSLGIDLVRVERKVGRPKNQWSPLDLADLTVDYQSIRTGEIRAEEVFPPTDLDVDDLAPPRAPGGPALPPSGGQRPPTQPVTWTPPVAGAAGGTPSHGHSMSGAPAAPPALDQTPGSVTSRQVVRLNEVFAGMPVRGTGQSYARGRIVRALAQRTEGGPGIESLTDLSEAEAQLALDTLVGDAGVEAVVDILTRDGAPAHLIPPLPAPPAAPPADPPEAPVAAAGDAQVEDPAAGYDPTTEPGFGVDAVTGMPPAAATAPDERSWYGDPDDQDPDDQGGGAS